MAVRSIFLRNMNRRVSTKTLEFSLIRRSINRHMWKKVKQKSAVKEKGNRAGQALMEFILGLMIMISFFFFFMKMSGVFVIGNFIHYATFMSARAYMSSNTNQGAQLSNGEDVLRKMVANRWKNMIKPDTNAGGSVPGGFVGSGPSAQDSLDTDFWNQGTTFSFNANLSMYPWNKDGQGVILKLSSESWMPREESEDECQNASMKGRILQSLSGALPAIQAGDLELDNGC